jgi:uncharacterized protein YjgD (DUF1641 family)
MAQPILTYRPKTDQEKLRARLEAAPIDHVDAILSAFALLRELQDHGVLDLLRGLTGASGDIVTRLSEGANTSEAIAAVRNLTSMLRILGSLDPDILHELANIVTKPTDPNANTFGFWKTVKRLGSKDTLRAIGAMAYGMQVFGRVLVGKQFKD